MDATTYHYNVGTRAAARRHLALSAVRVRNGSSPQRCADVFRLCRATWAVALPSFWPPVLAASRAFAHLQALDPISTMDWHYSAHRRPLVESHHVDAQISESGAYASTVEPAHVRRTPTRARAPLLPASRYGAPALASYSYDHPQDVLADGQVCHHALEPRFLIAQLAELPDLRKAPVGRTSSLTRRSLPRSRPSADRRRPPITTNALLRLRSLRPSPR